MRRIMSLAGRNRATGCSHYGYCHLKVKARACHEAVRGTGVRNSGNIIYNQVDMAERVGFEPTIESPLCRISSAVLSTTQPPLRLSVGTGKPSPAKGDEALRSSEGVYLPIGIGIRKRFYDPYHFFIRLFRAGMDFLPLHKA